MRPLHLCFTATLICWSACAFAQTTEPAKPTETIIEEPYQSLRTELLQILEDDQKYRKQMEEIGVSSSLSSERNRELLAKMNEADAANLIKVKVILDQHGWLGPEKVGKEASEALFLAIQHGDLAAQQKYLPMMRQAVKDKKLGSKSLPLLEDRVALKSGLRQIYGTQIGNGEAMGVRNYVSPLKDPDNVDKRRAEVGLGPLAEYVKRWGIIWDVEEYKKQLPEIEAFRKKRYKVSSSPALQIIPELNKPLQAELMAIFNDDQKYRNHFAEVQKKFGESSKEVQDLSAKMATTDAANVSKVTAILDSRGWLGPEDVGTDASGALFLVVQHADLATQKKYIPLLRAAVIAGKARIDNLALLEDRIATREGRRQMYGSQIGYSDTTRTYFVKPLEDPDNVDKRRAEVGLGPLADYVKKWEITWDVEIYKKQLPELEKIQKK